MNKEIFYKNPILVIYIPGYLSGDDRQEEVVAKLKEFYKDPNTSITVFNWDSVASYVKTLQNSVDGANKLIKYLKELLCTPNVILVGHSLGALVIAHAMLKMPANAYYCPKQIIFLGAALNADFNLKPMCSLTEYPLINVVNPNDVVLSTAYRTFNDSPALGQIGSYYKNNKNYVEMVILPKSIKSTPSNSLVEVANQLLDLTGHSASRVYLDSLIKGKYKIRG